MNEGTKDGNALISNALKNKRPASGADWRIVPEGGNRISAIMVR